MLHEAARLHQAGRIEGVERDQKPRREGEPFRHGVGLVHEPGAQFDRRLAEPDAVAGLQAQPGEQDIGRRRPVGPVFLPEQSVMRKVGIDAQRAVERVGAVHGLDFDQCLVRSVRQAGHGAHVGALGNRAEAAEIGLFRGVGAALVEFIADIPAEQDATLPGYAGADRFGDGIDAADRRHAERDAGQEDRESGKAAAHLAQREAEGESQRLQKLL